MTAPVFNGFGALAKNGYTASLTPALPTYAAGDKLLAFVIADSNRAIAAPAGWVASTGSPHSYTTTMSMYLFERTATASESVPTFALDTGNEGMIAGICGWTGWDSLSVVFSDINDTTLTAPAAGNATGDSHVLRLCGVRDGNDNSMTTPATAVLNEGVGDANEVWIGASAATANQGDVIGAADFTIGTTFPAVMATIVMSAAAIHPACNMTPLAIAVSDWVASLIDGKVRGFNKTGGSTYGSKGWNDGSFLGTGTEYFADPAGSSGNDGLSAGNPWPLAHAIAQLTAGDTLTLLDGTYTDPITPATATQSGTEGEPITVRAQTYGNVIIEPTASTPAIEFYSNFSAGGEPDINTISGWTVDGVICRTNGEVAAVYVDSQDFSEVAVMTHNIALKRIGAFGSAVDENIVVFSMARVANCIFEDTFAYGRGRKAYQAYGCEAITIRNAVGRYDYWDGAAVGGKPNDPRNCMSCYNTQNSLFENIIVFDSADTPATRTSDRCGMIVSGNEAGGTGVDGSSDNLIINAISLNNVGNGIENNGGSGSPTTGIVFKNVVSWANSGYGITVSANSDGTTFLLTTSGANTLAGIRYNPSPGSGVPIINQILQKSFATDNGTHGIYSSSGNMEETSDCSGSGNTSGSVISGVAVNPLEPTYAPTLTSIVEPVVVSGFERGATILKKSVNGALTDTDLWPYPYEDIIKAHMLNATDLTTCLRTGAGVGVPGWKTADDIATTSLSEYVRSHA